MNIILLGGPGAGKGTQAEFLIKEYEMLHISTGDLLRAAVKEGTEQGKLAKKYMEAGDLVPDEVIIGIMKEKFDSEDISNGLILDGFPRTTAQAEALDEIVKIDLAILIDTPEDVIINRICNRRMCKSCGFIGNSSYEACPKCGGEMYQRADDNEETVRNRIDVYNKSTAPLIDYYQQQDKLAKVLGEQGDPKNVFEDVKKLLA